MSNRLTVTYMRQKSALSLQSVQTNHITFSCTVSKNNLCQITSQVDGATMLQDPNAHIGGAAIHH